MRHFRQSGTLALALQYTARIEFSWRQHSWEAAHEKVPDNIRCNFLTGGRWHSECARGAIRSGPAGDAGFAARTEFAASTGLAGNTRSAVSAKWPGAACRGAAVTGTARSARKFSDYA
jgi:hypothetical protein